MRTISPTICCCVACAVQLSAGAHTGHYDDVQPRLIATAVQWPHLADEPPAEAAFLFLPGALTEVSGSVSVAGGTTVISSGEQPTELPRSVLRSGIV